MTNQRDEIHRKLDTLVSKVAALQEDNRHMSEKLRARELENEALKKELSKKEADLEAIIQRIEQISL